MARGTLRIYLGASPGVGKTYAMLNEGRRRLERGADVVIGVVETHGRPRTAEQLGNLEVVPRRSVDHRGTLLTDMDTEAVLARRPDVVLVDEYAHTNAPGGRHEKRWEDVEALLAAGIDVVSTLNIQHLESLNDVIAEITGITQRETVPDAVVRRADQIELVDMSPEALRRRLAHGNVYPPERIDAALSNFFRPGNLGALRELALLWVADRVEESLASYLAAHDITRAWETRERVVVGLSGAPDGDALIRRAARMAGRVGGDLIGVHIASDDGLTRTSDSVIAGQRRLVESLGGRTHEIVGQDTAASLVAFARAEKATQLVIGATRRSRVYDWLHGSFVTRVTRLASDLDIHVFGRSTTPDDTPTRPSSRRSGSPHLGRRRTIAAWLIALIGLPALTGIVCLLDSAIELSTTLLLFLAVVLLVAAIGGRLVAAISAVAASVLVNWFFVEPRYTFTISRPEQVVALGVFVAVALTVGVLVDQSARRAAEARRARLEAAALARSAASLAADPEPLPALVEQICRTFDLAGARITTEGIDGVVDTRGSWGTIDAPTSTVIDLRSDDTGRSRRLEISGRRLSADDRRVVGLLADQLAVALDTEFLAREAAAAVALSEIDGVRTALLRAVSHDLRTPISTIKALVTGLLDDSVHWTPDQLHDALADVDHETDRLDRLVGNLLDASRLQIGALAVHRRPTSLADVVEAALDSLGPEGVPVEVSVSDDLPAVDVDPALLERCIANVVSNAVRHAASTGPVLVTAEAIDAVLHLRVVDRGPGIPVTERDRVLAPFQRLGDRDTSTGVGLGLAITNGFVEAMHGAVLLDDTAGGGLTVTLILPTVPAELAP